MQRQSVARTKINGVTVYVWYWRCYRCNKDFKFDGNKLHPYICHRCCDIDLQKKANKKILPYRKSQFLEGMDALREKIRQRDNHKCLRCGLKWVEPNRRLDVHHLDVSQGRYKSYTYDKSNSDKLVTLCHKCHLKLHAELNRGVDNFPRPAN